MGTQPNSGPAVRLSLLGGFRLMCDGRPVSLRASRMKLLLAYLALHPEEGISRQRLGFLFWPDSTERQARTNVRQLLHRLRQTFPLVSAMIRDTDTISWPAGISLYVDVHEFRRCLTDAARAARVHDIGQQQAALERATALYRGDLMPDAYEDWIETERQELRSMFAGALESLAELGEALGDYASALAYADRLLILDTLNEAVYRRLMRLHVLNHDRARALHTYKRCVRMLQEELGVTPDAATRALRDRIARSDKAGQATPAHEEEIPLVGRQHTVLAAREVWQKSAAGAAHVLTFRGEAGIGKTRLAEDLRAYLENQGYITVCAACHEAEGSLAYGPIAEWLRAAPVYTTALTLPAAWQAEIVRLLPELAADIPDLPPPAPLTESWQRQRLFAVVTQTLLALPQPFALFLDDIHWCDDDTLAWLHYALRSHPSARMLIVATARAGAMHANPALQALFASLRRADRLTILDLSPLDAEETARLARHVAGGELSDNFVDTLYRRTEGNPFFAVEMARAASQVAPLSLPEDVLPRRVQDVIHGRLAQLSPSASRLLALAAIVGHRFSYAVLARACGEESILSDLEELWQHRLIYEVASMEYAFAHGIIREVVQARITGARAKVIHRRVAQALEQVHKSDLNRVSKRLAYHWEEAGEPRRAITAHLAAGRMAQHLYANLEAEHHLEQGLRLCRDYLDGEERDSQMLALLQALSPSVVQGRGYGARQVQMVGEQVQALSHSLNRALSAPQLRMQAISHLVVGHIGQAEELGQQLLALGEKDEDRVAQVEAHYVLGVTHHWSGAFVPARHHLERAIALYTPQCHETHIRAYAQDPAVVCRVRLSLVLWHLGHPLGAERMGEEALALAREFDHPFSRAYALHWFAWLQNLRGDAEATLRAAGTSISFSEDYHFPYFATQSKVLLGWALWRQGYHRDGVQMMRSGLAYFRSTDSEVGCAYYRALIAEALAGRGAVRQSLVLLAEACKGESSGDEHWSDARVHIIRGNVLRSCDLDAAATAYKKAIAVARKQKNRMDALQAATCLQSLQHGDAHLPVVLTWALDGLPAAEQEALRARFAIRG